MFATYQSSPKIAEAFRHGEVPGFDLVVADEAHRCAGRVSSDFGTVLDADAIPARRRLFMTATPRYFTGRVVNMAKEADFEVAPMDDETRFGPVLHRLGFAEAIDRGLLTDYQVVIVGVDDDTYRDWAERGRFVTTDGTTVTDARTLAGQIGLAKAMRRFGLRRTISFHSRVSTAREFARSMPELIEWMPADQRPGGRLWSDYAPGEMLAGSRAVLLDHLRHLDEGENGLLANARCLAEGVDVPALDGVAFIDPRRSEVDIVQAVGRAIRLSENKLVGTIVLPVFIDTDDNPETALDDSAFKPVWDVIKALRAHDDQLGAQLDELRRELGRSTGHQRIPSKIILDLPARIGTEFADAFETRLIERTTANWEFWYGLLARFTEREGKARPPAGHVEDDGYRLGSWVTNTRAAFGKGKLDAERANRLEALPGWTWNAQDAKWENGFEYLARFAEREGDARPPQDRVEDGYPLRTWVSGQRTAHRKGALDAERVARLEALPGWTWNARDEKWENGFENLARFAEREGDARPSQDQVEDGYPIGKWVNAQRVAHGKGALDAERVARLEALLAGPGTPWTSSGRTASGAWPASQNAKATHDRP